MNTFRLFFYTLILMVPAFSFCQLNHQYQQILAIKAPGKTFIYSDKTDTSWVTYLGTIGNNKGVEYFVVKEFSQYKAALAWHGHSKVHFYNRNKKRVAEFDVGMPEFLPDKLVNNTLFFQYLESGIKKIFKVEIDSKLPPVICTRPSRCDEVITLK